VSAPDRDATDAPFDFLNQVLPSDAEFGPDTNGSTEIPLSDPSKPIPRVNRKNEPRETKSVFGKLGSNKKLRSPVRKLDEKDRDKIKSWYEYGAIPVMAFNPTAAQKMMTSAETCADAWVQLADENDKVRRTLLAFMEGGVWGALFFAHLPILVALVPPEALPERMRPFMTMQMGTPDVPPS